MTKKKKKRAPQRHLKIYYDRDSYEFDSEGTIEDVTHCCNGMKNNLEDFFHLGLFPNEDEPVLLLEHSRNGCTVKLHFCPFCGAQITIKVARL